MAKKAYSKEEKEAIREALLNTGQRVFAEHGYQHTTLAHIYEEVGISKTFFYSFFESKEVFMEQVLYYQQPKLIAYAKTLMEDSTLTWREGITKFLTDCCYGNENGIMIMSIEEEQEVYRYLSPERFKKFRNCQMKLFSELLNIFGLPNTFMDVCFFANTILSVVLIRKSIPDTIPFLFPQAADMTADFQIRAIVDYMAYQRSCAEKLVATDEKVTEREEQCV